ncbi:hypothetical protein [Pontibacter cellulosilyticus]|uniref:Uncharacterized protein n=1 Tax=Pontibacter cellulosilyticus TaxID=1720253 RepID=A0A923SPI9_9BACT|nr:hypothetical protein [Pontibacter cellulosilyticus]MBC5994195.1 hypothetical protein [Pontibacter cellulosilyticus]
MTAEIRNGWHTLNKVLTIINLILLGLVTFNLIRYKEIKDKKIPVIANILLMLFLGLGLYAAIYQLRYS